MDLLHLRTFVAVAELASFSRAAERLHLTQPAVSQQVKRLEDDLGAALLARSTRRVELTQAGQLLLTRARAIFAEVDRAESDIGLVAQGRTGRVSIGFVGTATYDLLPQVARNVRHELPGVELEIYGEQLNPALADALLQRRLDVAVMRNPQPHPALTTRSLRTERLIAVVPSDHPAARGGQVALRDLQESAFVIHPSGTRSVMHGTVLAACRQAGFAPVEIIEARETATLVAFVAAGIGVALLPGPVRSLALDGVAYLPLSDVDQQTELVLAMRSDEQSSATHRVAELVANVAQATSAVTCGRCG